MLSNLVSDPLEFLALNTHQIPTQDYIKNLFINGYILQEELYRIIFAAYQDNFAENYDAIITKINESNYTENFIIDSNGIELIYRENLNCESIKQILEDGNYNWHEEFGFFRFPENNFMVSRSIAILEDHAPVVVAVNGSNLTEEYFKGKTPEITHGYLLEGKVETTEDGLPLVLSEGMIHDAICRTAQLDQLTTIILI